MALPEVHFLLLFSLVEPVDDGVVSLGDPDLLDLSLLVEPDLTYVHGVSLVEVGPHGVDYVNVIHFIA